MSHNYTQRRVYVNKCDFAAAGIVQKSAARREKSPGVDTRRRQKIGPAVKRREGREKTYEEKQPAIGVRYRIGA